MIEVPNMRMEILEALDFYFADMPEVEADCLLYLSALQDHMPLLYQLSEQARHHLNQMGRCERCGEKFQLCHHTELHDEVDKNCYEDMTDVYCPNCDMPDYNCEYDEEVED